MLNKKGFTLVEILIAMALLMVIAVAFVSSMTTNFSWLVSARVMTQNVFAARQSMEAEIESIKKDLLEGVTPDDKVSVTLFDGEHQRSVDGYYREKEIAGNRVIRAIIADIRNPDYPVPIVNSTLLRLRHGGAYLANNYDYVLRPGLSARATSVIADPDNVFLLNRHEWFVSRAGFNIPMVSDELIDKDLDLGRLYPIFPYDYNPVPIKALSDTKSENDLTSLLSEYTGRHIIYTITPYAMSGRKGTTVFSDPVYLHGPTVTDGLVLHLDASLISKDSRVSDIVKSGDNIFVSQWNDLSGKGNHAVQSSNNLKPKLIETQYQDDVYVWGKCLQENTPGTKMRISSFNPDKLGDFTMILVAKSSGNQENTNIISGGNGAWSFGWNGAGNLAFAVEGRGSIPAELTERRGLDGEWHIFTAVVSGNDISVRVDGQEETTGIKTSSGSVPSGAVEINWNNVEIAEILLYHRDLTTGLDLVSVETYLINKYNPDPEDVQSTIAYLKPLSPKTIIKGESFIPPSTVEAVMTNGSTQRVPVSWSGTIDTSVAGTQTITAAADMDSTKTTVLTVYVVEIEKLIPHTAETVTLKLGERIDLPSRLDAQLTNGKTLPVEVTWSSSTPGATVSNSTLTGNVLGNYPNSLTAAAVLDPNNTAVYTVEVTGISVTGVSVEPSSLNIPVAQTRTLTAIVEPANATDKRVEWSSSNPSVATVDDAGEVTAIAAGRATITARTVDGGYEAQCTINVPAVYVGYEVVGEPTVRKILITYYYSVTLNIKLSDGTVVTKTYRGRTGNIRSISIEETIQDSNNNYVTCVFVIDLSRY